MILLQPLKVHKVVGLGYYLLGSSATSAMIYLVLLFWLKHRYGVASIVTLLYFFSLLLTPLAAQANPSKLDSSCRSLIDRSISSAGFTVQPSGFIIDRIRSSSSPSTRAFTLYEFAAIFLRLGKSM